MKNSKRIIAAALIALALFPLPVYALDPHTKIAGLVHTTFKGGELPLSNVLSLAQTKDGYLWVATTEGLFRFDGLRFTRPEPLSREQPRGLLATRDGSLWLVFDSGRVSRLFQGQLKTFPLEELPRTNALAEDRDGSIIAATAHGGLARFRSGRWMEVATALHHAAKVSREVHFDRDGVLWLLTENSLLKLPPDADHFTESGIQLGLPMTSIFRNVLTQSPDGAVWFANGDGVYAMKPAGPVREVRVAATAVLADRQGSLWIGGNQGQGLWRVPVPAGTILAPDEPGIEQFTQKDGLSGDQVICALEDREGNVWIGTNRGLDRFREGAFHKVAVPDAERIQGIEARKEAGVVLAMNGRPYLWMVGPDEKMFKLQIGIVPTDVGVDTDGTLWVASWKGFARWSAQGLIYPPQPRLTGINSFSCKFGELWLADAVQGVFRYSAGKTENISGLRPQVSRFLQERPGRVWATYPDGKISIYDHGSILEYGARDGAPEGSFWGIDTTANGDVWLGSEHGLTRFRGGHFETVDVTPGLRIRSVKAGDGNFLWLRAGLAMARMDMREFERALTSPGYRPQLENYGPSEGVRGAADLDVREGNRLWVHTTDGIGYFDINPEIRRNPLAPPVQIETVTADGKSRAADQGLRLPKLIHDLQIDYTALSLTAPEKVQFRYKLEGIDQNWQEPGARRRAYYNDLAPKNYRFRVKASNNDGVWNEEGAELAFSIDPAWYQTISFEIACTASILALVWGLYRSRVAWLAHQFNLRLEERVTERTRIARELHDTLLQTFQGLMLHLQAVEDLLPEGKAKDRLDQTLQRADRAIAEGRSAVYDLRSSLPVTNDLGPAIESLGHELSMPDSAAFHLSVEGAARDLHPAIRDEIYRIASEAIHNAFRHAEAHHIEVEISYGKRALRLRIRDDGKGIPPDVMKEGRRGHYGLCGMRERAGQVGGKLDIWSRPGSGAEIEFGIADSIAYRTRKRQSFWGLFRTKHDKV